MIWRTTLRDIAQIAEEPLRTNLDFRIESFFLSYFLLERTFTYRKGYARVNYLKNELS